jgi:hypothetical protein
LDFPLPEDDPSAPTPGAELRAASRDPHDRRAAGTGLDLAKFGANAWAVISLLPLARTASSARAARRVVAASRPAPDWDLAMSRAERLIRLRAPVRESDERTGKASGLRERSRRGAQLTMRPFMRIAVTLETPTGMVG